MAAENALRARPKAEEALKGEPIKRLQQKIGELVLDLDILKEATKDRRFPPRPSEVVRSDHGLIDQSRRFRAACRHYRLRPEFITPYTPE